MVTSKLWRYENTPLFKWQAATMRNYMTKIFNNGFKPKYYKGDDKVITGDHVLAWLFYDYLLAKCWLELQVLKSQEDVFNF